jgi:uncharacterized repeat protein (TIGR01451 family)
MLRPALTRGLLSLVGAAAIAALPSAAMGSVTLGQTTGAADNNCGSDQVLLQAATAGDPSYASTINGVVVSWSYLAGGGNPRLTFKVYHSTADVKVWFVRSGSAERNPGAAAGQIHPNSLNTFTESPGLPIQTGDVIGLTGRQGTGIGCIHTSNTGDVIRVKNPPDPAPGAESGGFLGQLPGFKIGVSAVVEPDADGDHFGDETQDGCPSDPAVHETGCPVDVQIVKTATATTTVGSDITYTLAVKNNHATATAPNVTVSDTLPSSLTFVAASAAQGSCSSSSPVSCTIGSLAPGQSTTVTIVAKTTATGPVTNSADVATSVPDTDAANNSSSFTTTVNEVTVVPPSRPVLSPVKLAPSAFLAAKSGPSVVTAAARGTVVSFTVSETATTTFSVSRRARGVRKGGKCVAPPRKRPAKKPKRCTRYVPAGSFSHDDVAGSVRFRFTGRVGAKALRPASYRLTAVARNAAGKSDPVRASFRVKKPKS